jgi:hypothetical protein
MAAFSAKRAEKFFFVVSSLLSAPSVDQPVDLIRFHYRLQRMVMGASACTKRLYSTTRPGTIEQHSGAGTCWAYASPNAGKPKSADPNARNAIVVRIDRFCMVEIGFMFTPHLLD